MCDVSIFICISARTFWVDEGYKYNADEIQLKTSLEALQIAMKPVNVCYTQHKLGYLRIIPPEGRDIENKTRPVGSYFFAQLPEVVQDIVPIDR